MMDEEHNPQAEEISQLFEFAERQIKATEALSSEIGIPAINQLRYAGHHLTRAYATTDAQMRTAQLQSARNHCYRAIHDAVELRGAYLVRQFEDFCERYRGVPITDSVPDFDHIREQVQKVRDLLSGQEGETQDEHDRNHKLIAAVDDLTVSMEKLRGTQFKLNASLSLMRKRVLQWAIGVVIPLLLGIVASLAASLLAPRPAPPPDIEARLQVLDDVRQSLETLITYVSDQKEHLQALETQVADLENEKKTLDGIVAARRDVVDNILDQASRRSRKADIILSFLTGVLSSLVVTVVVAASRKWRELNKRIHGTQ